MGLCYSLRSRLAAANPYGAEGDGGAAEHGDPQVRHRLRQDLLAKERADKKRSKSIDKTLKAEKREYKQTHRLLLLGMTEAEAQGGYTMRAAIPAPQRGSGQQLMVRLTEPVLVCVWDRDARALLDNGFSKSNNSLVSTCFGIFPDPRPYPNIAHQDFSLLYVSSNSFYLVYSFVFGA